ncbi:Pectinesterase [Rhynchospora pubera]|uniref:pectinesterase n=1 Tax=Rhynchospora pubera TaxID=906938 RepID=A0AAV8HFL6_9POAL|nr:Pectinesterase [Rhynchospora pubera]
MQIIFALGRSHLSTAHCTQWQIVMVPITGSGQIYLGRAWGQYSRVVYTHCRIDGIILPVGWGDWNDVSRRSTAYFGEYHCSGAGAKLESNVNWGRLLTSDEAKPFLTLDYVDGNQWLML